ncbi:MAG: GNAT family N-acetyltransferase [Bosea sp. (in: a-proteobacteria)]
MNLPDYIDLALVAACEERIVNAWPAPSTLMIEGWVVRFANGYSGRANSASPLSAGATLSEEALALIERLYEDAHLPPCIRITPLTHAGMANRLAKRGYRRKDASLGMVADLSGQVFEKPPGLSLSPRPVRTWIEAVAARQTPDKSDPDKLSAIVSGIRLPATFATLEMDGQPAALAMCVAERGLAEIGSVIVDAGQRGRGHGRRLMHGVMSWAAEMGCERAYLQVESNNAVAIRLYESLGFKPANGYQTWIRDGL